ncbi:hypothetical protein AB0F68_06200 [Micromonospora sp. NPDC023966]|uniref:hypothetical protein n=1 Tax=Micromonospora sp. NPDC023966 TaxID=3154699 RepID=UPI0033D62A93
MGTSYQNLLVIGELADVRGKVIAAGMNGWLVPAGPNRVVLLPREGEWDVADVDPLAKQLSADSDASVVTNEVVDSDAVVMTVYQEGRPVHRYVSDQSIFVDWFIDDEGDTKFRVNGVAYPADADCPTGPSGADPRVLAPFGAGPVDLERLGAILQGELNETGWRLAEQQHWAIAEALNLDPRALTAAFRWARHEDLPLAVRVRPETLPE